jgi:transposase
MPRTVNIPKTAIEFAHNIIEDMKPGQEFLKAIAVVLAAETDLSVKKITEILHTSESAFFRYRDDLIKQAKNDGIPIKDSWGGRRNNLLSPKDEKLFLSKYIKRSRTGEIVSANQIHQDLIQLVGQNIAFSTTTRLLQRNGWRKVMPNKHHPKSDPKIQENFKKKCHYYWLPPSNTIHKTNQ